MIWQILVFLVERLAAAALIVSPSMVTVVSVALRDSTIHSNTVFETAI